MGTVPIGTEHIVEDRIVAYLNTCLAIMAPMRQLICVVPVPVPGEMNNFFRSKVRQYL
jgi:hypothetical protein